MKQTSHYFLVWLLFTANTLLGSETTPGKTEQFGLNDAEHNIKNSIYSQTGMTLANGSQEIEISASRNLQTPLKSSTGSIEYRYGFPYDLELFFKAPYSRNQQTTRESPSQVKTENLTGWGDLSGGVKYRLVTETSDIPNLTMILAGSYPPGPSGKKKPEALALGAGTWQSSGMVILSKTHDPLVIYLKGGYTYTAKKNNEDDITYGPLHAFVYDFGTGFAVNQRFSFTTSIGGSYRLPVTVNGEQKDGSEVEFFTFSTSFNYQIVANHAIRPSLAFSPQNSFARLELSWVFQL